MSDNFIPAFSPSDMDVLRKIIAEDKARRRSTPSQNIRNWDEGQTAPEFYIALTPHYGIPPLVEGDDTGTALGTGDIPGHADCPVYRLIPPGSVTGVMEKTGVIKRIHNLSSKAIPGNKWILVSKDKFGQWYAIIPQVGLNNDGGECTGCGGWAGLDQGQCLKITIISASGKCDCIDTTQGPFYLSHTGYGWCWTASEDFDACDILGSSGPLLSGPFVFCLGTASLPGLSIGVSDLALDCCTCDPTTAYFRGAGDLLCDGELQDDPCANTFLVKVEMWCCTDPNWTGPGWYCVNVGNGCGSDAIKHCFYYGEPPCIADLGICSGPYDSLDLCNDACAVGTGTGTDSTPGTGTAGDVTILCCPDNSLPSTLYGTFTGGSSCLNGRTVSLTMSQFSTGVGQLSTSWSDEGAASNICGGGSCSNFIKLQCNTEVDEFGNVLVNEWIVNWPTSGPGCCFNYLNLISVSCNPFIAVIQLTLAGDGCGSGTATLTITE